MDRELTFDVNGPIHAVDHGGDGPPMLLVHGLGGSLLNWRDVSGALARTHHVWSIDLIGFGLTPRAGREATIANNHDVVAAVADQVGAGEPVVLVGNSMGGLISILVGSRHPRRVASVVLVDPALPMARGGRVPLMLAAAFMVMRAPRVGPWLVRTRSQRLGPERLVEDVLRLCTVDFVANLRRDSPGAHRADQVAPGAGRARPCLPGSLQLAGPVAVAPRHPGAAHPAGHGAHAVDPWRP